MGHGNPCQCSMSNTAALGTLSGPVTMLGTLVGGVSVESSSLCIYNNYIADSSSTVSSFNPPKASLSTNQTEYDQAKSILRRAVESGWGLSFKL